MTLSIYCVHAIFELWILFSFIILLFIRLIRDLDRSEELSPLTPGWYRESRKLSFGPWLVQRVSHLLLYYFLYTDMVTEVIF
jgi:hypothetical protein